MPYRLGDGEAVDHAVRRCAGEQLDRAIAELTDGVKADAVGAAHAARKSLKKERSLLRLARGSVSSSVRCRENAALRDAGRRLSAARDADVLVHALDDLSERYAGQLPKRSFAAIRKHLEAGGEVARGSVIDGGLTGEVAEDMRLLEPISKRAIRGQAQDAHLLSDLLGDDHDLALLRRALIEPGAALPVDVDSVIALIDHRRGQLQTDAAFLGERLYAEKPKAFRRRLHRYWQAWQAQTRAAESQHPAQLAQRTRHAAVA